MDHDSLDQALLSAHEAYDHDKLVRLYTIAADSAELEQDINASCFYLTHAFLFALENGAPEAAPLNKRLADRGRAKRLEF